jgi:hypothetical protein
MEEDKGIFIGSYRLLVGDIGMVTMEGLPIMRHGIGGRVCASLLDDLTSSEETTLLGNG